VATRESDDDDGLALGVGEGAEVDVVGCGDREPDGDTRADVCRSAVAEPCGFGTGTPLGATSGVVVTGSEAAVRCRETLRARR